MHLRPRPGTPHYTYEDYEQWPESMRCELINGKIYMMASPSWDHQAILLELAARFREFLKDKPCKVVMAPLDVRISANPEANEDVSKKDDVVLQPDLIVVCDKKKKQRKACIGAPDFVLEILSENTKKHDTKTKLDLYLQYGVREYWIVDPFKQTISCGMWHSGKDAEGERAGLSVPYYEWQIFENGEQAPVGIFNSELCIDCAEIFAAVGFETGNI
jgi:Uma2 family endonuclease